MLHYNSLCAHHARAGSVKERQMNCACWAHLSVFTHLGLDIHAKNKIIKNTSVYLSNVLNLHTVLTAAAVINQIVGAK